MAKTVGGPLLSSSDLLQDLFGENEVGILEKTSLDPTISSANSNAVVAQAEWENLQAMFEKTCKDLNAALKESGHSWTDLTQELYSTLTTADKLVAETKLNLNSLLDKAQGLERMLVRSDTVLEKLSTLVEESKI